MTRPLTPIPGEDPTVVADALREALDGSGPAILPQHSTASVHAQDSWSPALPETVPIDTALVIETSGSSGRPKRVMLTANALLSSAAAVEGVLGGPGQWLLALPVHYIAGAQVLIRSFLAETRPVILPPGHFDAIVFSRLSTQLEAERRYAALVPAQLARLVEAAEQDRSVHAALRRFDAFVVGGQALPQPLGDRAERLGLTLRRTYGSSETAGGCVYDGVPLAPVRVRENEGEIEIAGPVLASGYLGDAELTAERFYEDQGERWYRTSDGGVFADGMLRVYGRLDNVIISGGVKISLDAVERAVHTVPGFEDAVVVAIESEKWGQAPAVVLARPLDEAERAALHARVAQLLGPISAPREVIVVPSLPVLPSGKPDRRAITRMLAGPH